MKQDRLIELLIKEVEATHDSEGCSFGLNKEEGSELLELIRFYKERINIKIDNPSFNYPNEWNWAGFDYDRGYKDAETKFLKILKNKDEEIKKLTIKPVKND
jgi:hypothetical protein